MNNIVITTADNLLSSLFWSGYRAHRKVPITKVIVLPERNDIDFPTWFKPLAFFKMLGLRGIAEIICFKLFSSKVSAFEVCERVSVLDSLNQDALLEELNQSRVDVLISVGVPIVLSADILSVPMRHCLNIHNGDIRKFRGHFSTFWEVWTSQEQFCLTLHEMGEQVDSGVIYQQVCKNRRAFRGFQEVMFWKKETGGAVLARAMNVIDEFGVLEAQSAPATKGAVAKYYPFPSVGDVVKFHF